jgi:hypothetical protein
VKIARSVLFGLGNKEVLGGIVIDERQIHLLDNSELCLRPFADARRQVRRQNQARTTWPSNGKASRISRRHLLYTQAEVADIAKEMRMNLKDWDATIKQIMAEIDQEPSKSRKHKVLFAWRVRLEEEPTSLQPFQIDEIVREVRKRLGR